MRKSAAPVLACLFSFIGFCLSFPPILAAAQGQPLKVVRITPSGTDVPSGRQIVIQFNRPVVPLGRMERTKEEVKVGVHPELKCQWRWLNTSALACQLGEDDKLQPATQYEVNVRPGIQAEDGATIDPPYLHRFITHRPRVRYAWFQTWKAPGWPVMRITFDQPVTQTSVAEHLYLLGEGNKRQRYPLSVEPDPNDRQLPVIVPIPGDKGLLHLDRPPSQKSDDQTTVKDGVEARRVWLVQPQKELSWDADVFLNIEPGLVSALGPEPGVTQRTVKKFRTFPEFRFIGVSCWNNENRQIIIDSNTTLLPRYKCNPLRGVSLTFSAPVINQEIKQHVTFVPDLAGGRTDYDPWANAYDHSRLRRPHRKGRRYDVHLPEALQAAQEYNISSSAGALKDEFGRSLPKGFDLTFNTDHRNPDFHLEHTTATLEKQEQTEVPLVVTNLKEITLKYKRLTATDRKGNLVHKVKPDDAEDIAYALPLDVRGALGGKSGVLYGHLDTKPDVPKPTYQRTLLAQVTPFGVHVKMGHYNSSVWVTDLATGQPVPDAHVMIYKDKIADLSADKQILSDALTGDDGLALLDGTQKLDPKLKAMGYGWYDDTRERLFVRIERGEDMALVPLDDQRFGVDSGRVSNYEAYPSMQRQYGHIQTWGTTAQGVYRAGDTIQFKLFVRDQDNKKLIAPPLEGYRLEVRDPMGKKVHEMKDITLSKFGTYAGEFSVAKSGAVGWYEFRLRAKFSKSLWTPLEVLVTDFTPSPFRVSNSLNGEAFEPGSEVEITTLARMHAGGPYADAPARLTATLREQTFYSRHPRAKQFRFTAEGGHYYQTLTLYQKEDAVNAKGDLLRSFKITDQNVENIFYGTLSVESAVKDDRGKFVASLTTAKFHGRDRFVGLHSPKWLYKEDEPANIEYIVVDGHGKPVSGTPVSIKIERHVTKASRVKGAGNAYLTQYTHSWEKAGDCKGTPSAEAKVCTFTPEEPGSYRLTATITDTKGRTHTASLRTWVAGKGRVVWAEDNTHALQLIPEKEEYQIGDTARFLVQNPFPGAKALISVERYGVLKQWVTTFDTATPVVEFDVEPDFLPGFYLSVLVVSPRVEKPLDETGVDLGKPTFRMGYTRVPVKDPYKELVVTARTEKGQYKPRDTIKVALNVKPRFDAGDRPYELAVAVLDEAVFDLLQGGRDYFDPYKGLYHLGALDLKNFSLLTRIVGRQKFEKKGANPGGDGGADLAMRSLFKFVSYWNPALTPDANGNVSIEFEAPDNLTGWRVLAFAVTPNDLMGLGEGTFKVNKETELRPVMPNQVTEGDAFNAGFSVMNRTDKARDITVTIKAEGHIDIRKQTAITKTITLEPFKRQTVFLPITTIHLPQTRDIEKGEVRFRVTAGDDTDRDGLIYKTPVLKRRSLETAANYVSTILPHTEESIAFPKNIHPDVGSVGVVLSPTVIGNVAGAFEYMRNYAYICWEQVLSKGVMASHYLNLKDYMPADFKWEEADDVARDMLKSAVNYQAPNGGMVYYIPQDRYVSPYLSAYTALAFNWMRSAGYEIPSHVEEALHKYLKRMLKRDVLPTFYSKDMASTVRAVALAALSKHRKVRKKDIERFRTHMPFMSLFGKAHFLQAALNVKGTLPVVEETLDAILAHSTQSGGKFVFSETLDDSYSRILASPLRTNCAILTALTQTAGHSNLNKKLGNAPFKLVRYITQTRGQRDHWENTQENMFCMNALIDYSRAYEQTDPKYLVTALMDGNKLGEHEFKDKRDPTAPLTRPIEQGDPGRKTKVVIKKKGMGRLYISTRLQYAPLEEHAEHINAGIEIRKEYAVERNGEWVLLNDGDKIQRGELVRVDIFLSIPAARNFVVVDDPVPGGLEPVNRQLATASTVDADKGTFKAAGGSWWLQYSDWRSYNYSRWSFYHKELRHDAVRFYSDYLMPGNYHLSYVAQAIATGKFLKMPVHAEEMYDPDVYGKGIPSHLIVEE
ncbi:conserved exported hypothetical protein [Nitrospina gracilis 3/211]|uniref:Large extracellular alpha-helical protein n=1 Tax=Nitrospina gracilis (strain 3/211) TaxID=1266370 RepID=M1YWF1_NITG3|nr:MULTISPECIES: alpha-2-macroglobulin family protein [Nitrospina]MCF8722853.1 uncharacterized protein YfaS (alpha-2-macroglobulin family) [Nitrospina sp. Nb-3]CCQ89813.1 conserved exported hypothetical protein [Nitrospina gracilis 3/211]